MPIDIIARGMASNPKGAFEKRGAASLLARPRDINFICCGNSITARSMRNDGLGSYAGRSEIVAAMQFGPPNFYQADGCVGGPGYTTTFFDPPGNFGYSSQNLATITTSCATTWFPILDYARIAPDLVIGHSLAENDLYEGASAATIQTRINTWINLIRLKYPGAIIQLCTNRPDGRIAGDSAKVAAALATYTYMLSLDDGQSIFVTDTTFTDAKDPASWAPKAGYAYLNSTSESLALQDGIHPRENMASIDGRLMAATWRRIAGTARYGFGALRSPNLGLTGSVVISAGKMSGTSPGSSYKTATGASPAGAAAAIVTTALDPGWRLQFTPDAGTLVDIMHVQAGSHTPTRPPKRFAYQGRFTINSGASIMGSVDGRIVITYADAATSTHLIKGIAPVASDVTSDVYRDGDVINLQSGPITPTAGKTIADIFYYIRLYTNGTGQGPLDITVNHVGHIPLLDPDAPAGITPGASPYAYQNTGTTPQDVIVSGGTVSAIDFSRTGGTYYTTGQTAGMFRLEPWDFLKVTYSVAPTMTAIPR